MTQRDEDRSDEGEDDYCVNENSNKDATILKQRLKVTMELCSPKVYPVLYSDAEALKTLFVYRVVQENLFSIVLILQQMFLKNFCVRTLY